MRSLGLLVSVLALTGCGDRLYLAGPRCTTAIDAVPANIAMNVGDALIVTASVEPGCPAPLIRNETPAIIRADSVGAGQVRIDALALGSGRVRLRSRADTTVTTLVSVFVSATAVAVSLSTPQPNER